MIKCPVTVITGFFGAGKTTLLKNILKGDHGKRIAVVQNEFSDEMGIESPVLVDSKGEAVRDIVELPNGCICCAVKDDMVAGLDRLLQSRRGEIDHILVETTGISDPQPISAAFWVDSELESEIYLDGIVTLVDAKNLLKYLNDTGKEEDEELSLLRKMKNDLDNTLKGVANEAAKQIAYADRIIINKSDLVTPEVLRVVNENIHQINPIAPVLTTSKSNVSLDFILNLGAFSTKTLSFDASDHHHHHLVQSCFFSIPSVGFKSKNETFQPFHQIFLMSKIREYLADVLWDQKYGNIYRCKAIFTALDDLASDKVANKNSAYIETAVSCGYPTLYAMQGVGDIFEFEEITDISNIIFENNLDIEIVRCKFLFIGQNLKKESLKKSLNCALTDVLYHRLAFV
eukprot:GHVL01020681.1.p1 GENE.GHVL01020681.1~~GHVL01020681.1.p1  ORF type:complete len:401 (-),score=73.07 GHVL01020681.1:699-1901(-)